MFYLYRSVKTQKVPLLIVDHVEQKLPFAVLMKTNLNVDRLLFEFLKS